MIRTKKSTWLLAFALFSLFFGAGNLILPPLLGLEAGASWTAVALGFCLSAVFIPVLGIVAHSRLQGSLYDLAKPVSGSYSLLYCLVIYSISISLPSPRTASVSYEMGIAPLFEMPSWVFATIYFGLVFACVWFRSKILDWLGKILTPALLLLLFTLIGAVIFNLDWPVDHTPQADTLSKGLLEGYQTFDAIGSVVVGGVIIISVNLKFPQYDLAEKQKLIARAGFLAGLGLLTVYIGLILAGAKSTPFFPQEISRADLLIGITRQNLGATAQWILSLMVSLACFTTAVGIITGTSDFIKEQLGNSQRAYRITAFVACVIGVLVGQWRVDFIIAVAVPALMLVYPVTIVLILLNVLPKSWTSRTIFRIVVGTTMLFSLPDFLGSVGYPLSESMTSKIPLQAYSLGWFIPAAVAFGLSSILTRKKGVSEEG
ncbi:branched-chain amino acid transport system II carrier protein [Aureicoccus marinus]|uniref:Branched-chain amino acid transport system II carrier protein n=1 Tax=Aureicoccus marinus TaxID=754435 RepID=A0A2S7T8D7_9FLAO|nr:branched-chain amino acid transport system II carrier protein [Aureicoccus marinus]PQJ16192.1 branched-chain amino acid transport system II carrier protein [Aureicoccus marinus]